MARQKLTVRTSGSWVLYRHDRGPPTLVKSGVLDVAARKSLIRTLSALEFTTTARPASACKVLPQVKVTMSVRIRGAHLDYTPRCGPKPDATVIALEATLRRLTVGRSTLGMAFGSATAKKCRLEGDILFLSAALPKTPRPGYPRKWTVITDNGAWIADGRAGCLGRKALKKLRKSIARTRFGRSHHPSVRCTGTPIDRYVVASPKNGKTVDWREPCGGAAISHGVRALKLDVAVLLGPKPKPQRK